MGAARTKGWKELRSILRQSPVWVLAAFCVCSAIATVAYQAVWFDRIGEAGFGDGYVLGTVRYAQRTGAFYAPVPASAPFPGRSVYGPMLYATVAAAERIVSGQNPGIGPRLLEILVFLLCLLVTASIAHALFRHRAVWWWSALLVLSAAEMRQWILQIRGDFPAILFGLLAIRILLTRWRWAALLAGACAGFATQFKFNYVSAIAAGILWLALRREWRKAAHYLLMAIVTSVGGYLLFSLREPAIFSHIFAVRHPVTDYPGIVKFAWHAIREPAALLGLGSIPLVLLRPRRNPQLLLLYLAVSFVISSALEAQAGGSINYFFEVLFAIAPFAAWGALQLGRYRAPVMSLFVAGLLLTQVPDPAAQALSSIRIGRTQTQNWNRQMTALQMALRGTRVLSTVLTVTQLAADPVIAEPFLGSELNRTGVADYAPIAAKIRNNDFDIVVTQTEAGEWRGVELIPPILRNAIASSYQPYCAFQGWLFFKPAGAVNAAVLERLQAIGCETVAARASEHTW